MKHWKYSNLEDTFVIAQKDYFDELPHLNESDFRSFMSRQNEIEGSPESETPTYFKVSLTVREDWYTHRAGVWNLLGGDYLGEPTKENLIEQLKLELSKNTEGNPRFEDLVIEYR